MSLLGGYFNVEEPGDLLERMAGAMGYSQALIAQRSGDNWGLCAIGPRAAGERQCIAVSEDGQVAVAVAGYLFDAGEDGDRGPGQYCLDLYEQYGKDFPKHLNGTFAIAVLDNRRQVLLLVADPMFTRPLFYRNGRDCVFASQVKGVLADRRLSSELNSEKLREFLTLGSLLGPSSYYREIKQVPGGTVVEISATGERQWRYWPPRFEEDSAMTLEEAAELLATVISKAVQRACPADKRIVHLLSGGIDSRTVAACLPPGTECVTMHRVKDREVMLAQSAAAALGHKHTFIELGPTFPLDIMEEVEAISEGMYPFNHGQALAVRAFTDEVGAEVVSTGWMFDAFFQAPYLPNAELRLGPWGMKIPRLLPYDEGYPSTVMWHYFAMLDSEGMAALLGRKAAERLRQRLEAWVADLQGQARAVIPNPYDEPLFIFLSNLCRWDKYLNVACFERMAQQGMPFCDHNLVTAALSIPMQHRFNSRAYRRALALISPEAARIPLASRGIRALQNEWSAVGTEVIQRLLARMRRRLNRSLGTHLRPAQLVSWPQMGEALYATEAGRSLLRTLAADAVLCEMGILKHDGLQQTIEDHIGRKRDGSRFLLAWLTLEHWLRAQH